MADPACTKITSIDPRPRTFADERGLDLTYEANSTQRMLELLGAIVGADVAKIQSFEADTRTLDPAAISPKPDYCFIDGEHTNEAALRDARFCLSVVNEDGCIAFHDANVVYEAIDLFLKELAANGVTFTPYVLADAIFVVELGGSASMAEREPIRSLLHNNYEAYLFALKSNEWYRAVLNKPLFRRIRRTRFLRRLLVVPGLEKQGV